MTEDATADRCPRMRIAMLVHRFGCRFGGAEAYVEHLARELAERHDVTIVAFDYDSALMLPFIPIRAARWLPGWVKALVFAWRAHCLTREGFDIVHSHMNGWAGHVHTVHVTPVHHHVRFRDAWSRRLQARVSPRRLTYLALERARFGPGRTVVAVSQRIASQIAQCLPPPPTLPIVTPGVLPPLALPGARERQRRLIPCDADDIVCLLVARNPARKGLSTVLQAARALPAAFRFVVVGADGEAHRLLAAEAPAVRARVLLVAPTSRVAPWYCAADLYVHPTREDSFGMAPLEAMSYGLPVIVSDARHCGLAADLRDGVDALLLDNPADGGQLARQIQRLVRDAALKDALIANGRSRAARHGWHTVARQYEAIYARRSPPAEACG